MAITAAPAVNSGMSNVQAIPSPGTLSPIAVASVGVPTKIEFDAVVALVNDLRLVVKNAGLAV